MTQTGRGKHSPVLVALAATLMLAGCGGAGNAPADAELANDDVAYLTRLGRVRGQVRVAVELYRTGRVEDAAAHVTRPDDPLYAAFAGTFAARGTDGFAAELEAFATAVAEDAGAEAVDAAGGALLAAISEAESHVADAVVSDAEAQAAIVGNLLEAAAAAYARGVADGEVTAPHAYQRAYGLALVARERAETAQTRVIVRHDHEVMQRIVEAVEALPERFWPELVPKEAIGTDPAALAEVVERIRTEASRL